MDHQKILNLLNEEVILKLWQENGTLPIIIQKQVMV